MSLADEIAEEEELALVKGEFVKLWAKYPAYTPYEVARFAFKKCNLDPGFRFAQCADAWASDLEVLEQVKQARPLATGGDEVPDKSVLVAEMLNLARDPSIDAKDRHALYKTILEAEGHITKHVDKTVNKAPPTPPAILFKAVDFDCDPEELEDSEAA